MRKEGLVPTLLGSVVAGTSLASVPAVRKDKSKMITAGIVGFGVAHIVLGSIDLIQKR